MKTLTTLALAAALAAATASGSALASDDLAKKNGCIACHDAAAKKVGPTWKDIAAKNKGNEKGVAEAIVKGSKDKYGKIPMPPQAKAAADAPALAKWILTH
ncbi:MAG: c-type cytochrome [Pseudomonadota bacterium]